MTNVDEKKEKVFKFLDGIREAGLINMMGASPFIMKEFYVDRKEAKDILFEWMGEKR